VFVSYDQALGQRLSDRWLSPTSPRRHGSEYASDEGHSTSSRGGYGNGNGSRGIASQTHLPALPESNTNSPTDNSLGTWTRPFQSLLGSRYSASDVSSPSRSRRGTNLPPYTPGENGTYDPTTMQQHHFLTAEQEKAQLNRANTGPSRFSDRHPQSQHRATSSAAPSEIISIFGAPPSERRGSTATTDVEPFPSSLVSSARPQPTVNTNYNNNQSQHHNTRIGDSPASSQQANSAAPLLRHGAREYNPFAGNGHEVTLEERWADEEEEDRDRDRGSTGTGRHTSGSRSVGSVGSVARPDSDVMPFENFLNSLKRDGATE
jgi:hypothetical protein